MECKIKVVMVGDCANVGSTLIRYSPPNVAYEHIKRSRSFFSKTVGIALRIASSKGDLYHVHYGLQDHLLVKWLKKEPSVCHLHGSDLRYALRSRWGWVVKENLERADKVLVAVPDILSIARDYRPDAEYIPNPVNINLFKPMGPEEHEGFRVLFASDLSFVKGADRFIKEFAEFQREHPNSILRVIKYGRDVAFMLYLLKSLGVRHEVIQYQPHEGMVNLYRWADAVVTDMSLGYLHMSSLEAMACMRPVAQYINSDYYRNIPEPPVATINNEGLREVLCRLMDPEERARLARLQRDYVLKNHNPVTISARVVEVYKDLLKSV